MVYETWKLRHAPLKASIHAFMRLFRLSAEPAGPEANEDGVSMNNPDARAAHFMSWSDKEYAEHYPLDHDRFFRRHALRGFGSIDLVKADFFLCQSNRTNIPKV